jgi:S1-C subfamily serine protease
MRIAPVVRVSITTAVAAGITASATGAPADSRVTPETFARIASGVGLLRDLDCRGRTLGFATAFLVGSQVVVTANHAIGSSSAYRACRVQVRLGGRWYETSYAKAWYDRASAIRHVDLATLKLRRPAPGHVFTVARSLPARGSTIATIGHPRALPLSLHQGILRRARLSAGVPTLVMRIVAVGGQSGGPIVDRNGDVIGVLQRPAYPGEGPVDGMSFAAGLDLVRWFGASAANDLCRAYPRGGIPDCRPGPAPAARRRWVSLRPAGRR